MSGLEVAIIEGALLGTVVGLNEVGETVGGKMREGAREGLRNDFDGKFVFVDNVGVLDL